MADLSYRGLIAWQKAMTLVEQCFELTNEMVSRDRYGLGHQIRKSAISIPSNIAEGNVRRTRAVYTNHLDIALGSNGELDTQIELAVRLRLVSAFKAQPVQESVAEVGRLTYGLLRSLGGHRRKE
jgi:four helix bundle protein